MKKIIKKCIGVSISIGLVFAMGVSFVHATVGNNWTSLAENDVLIKDTKTKIADGVIEHEVVTNNKDGNEQKIDYITEIETSDKIKIVAGYGNNNADKWSLVQTSKQATAYEKANPGHTVVSAINADFFNMGTGEPLGALVMEGKIKHDSNGRYYFGITKDGKAVIRNNKDLSDLEAAVGGDALLIDNGTIMTENTAYGSLKYSRTAIGIKDDGTIVTFVTYGNRAPVSCGRTYMDIAQMFKDAGCTYALALDGGGSSTLLSRPEGTTGLQLRNNPVDGAERAVSSSLLIVSTVEATGVFSHAQLTPNNEVYTPGSKIQFNANGVDTAGVKMELPAGVKYELADDSKSMGTIDETTGLFTAGDTVGVVNVNLIHNQKVIGSTSIEIVIPDSIYFDTEEVSLGFDDESDLGLVVRNKGRDINYNNDDFKWSFTFDEEYIQKAEATLGNLRINAKKAGADGNKISLSILEDTQEGAQEGTVVISIFDNGELKESYNSNIITIDNILEIQSEYVEFSKVDDNGSDDIEQTEGISLSGGNMPSVSDVCTFKDNKLYTKDVTTKGIVTVSYGNVSGRIVTIIGKLPTVVWDFEDVINEDESITEAEDYYVGNKGILTHSNYGRGGNESIEIVSIDDEEPVRFGEKALKLNFDFRNCGQVTEGACVGTTEAIDIPGVPTGIGVWVYAPEGVGVSDWEKDGDQAGFWLRGYVKDGTGNNVPYDFTLEPKKIAVGSNDKPGIYWEGWKYLEADLTKLQAPYSIQKGMTFRLMYVAGTNMGTKTANSIYFDNLQFVYGANVDDIDNPVIDAISINGTDVKDGDVINSNVLNVDSIFHDVENKYTTGIDASTVRMYVDGVNVVDNDKYEYHLDGNQINHLYNLKLKDGSHSIAVSVRDGFGNETYEVRNFTVDSKSEDTEETDTRVQVVKASEPILGGKMLLQVKASKDDIAESTITLKLGAAYKEYEVESSENYITTQKYNKLERTITINSVRKEEVDPTEDESIIATISIDIPANLNEGDVFNYTVKSGEFSTVSGGYDTFSTRENKLDIKAEYSISVDPIIIGGDKGTINVKNSDKKVQENISLYLVSDDTLIGKTDNKGQLVTDIFNQSAGENKIYAKDDNGLLSFQYKVCSYTPYGDNNGESFNIRFNTVNDSTTQKNITWMSNPISNEKQIFCYKESDSENWEEVEAESIQTEFDKDFVVVDINNVFIKNLSPGTKYDYKIKAGDTETNVKSFNTEKKDKKSASFFILGDIQTDDKNNLKEIVNELSAEKYDFGIQIGDAIDQANDFNDWFEIGNIIGEKVLDDTEMISVMGNHEYYGDKNASIASRIYNNTKTEAGSYYSFEKNNIYIAVINFGDTSEQIKKASEWLKEDASKSKCTWKIVLAHQPVYYTNSVGGNEPVYEYFSEACETSDIDVMFSGHDHSFMRTNPLKNSEVVDDDGVVYYICGAIGNKRYPVSTMDKFDYSTIFATPAEEYEAAYLNVTSNKDEMTINMYKYENGNKVLFDSYTIKSECNKNGHIAIYDTEKENVYCKTCGDEISDYTGEAKDNKGNEYYVISGKIKTGWVTVGEEMRYYNNKGIREKVKVDETPSTCIVDGYCIYTSESGEIYKEEYNDAGGHEYEDKDGKSICSKCGWQRVEMSDVDVKLSYYRIEYNGKERTPSTTATNPITGETLKKVNPYRDYYSKYSNNVEVGTATVTLNAAKYGTYVNINDWRGNYKGSVTLTYEITPDCPKNPTISYDNNIATIKWDNSKMADEYVIYQSVNDGEWKEIATTKDTQYKTSVGYNDKVYKYRIGARKKANDGKIYESVNYAETEILNIKITSSNRSDGKPVIKWNKCDNTNYSIYRSTSKNGKYYEVFSTRGNTYTHISSTVGNTYYYKVTASSGGRTVISNTISCTCLCDKPKVDAANMISSGKPKISWKAVNGANKYEIYVSDKEDGEYVSLATVSETSFTHDNALPTEQYYYKVRGIISSKQKGEFSEIVTKTCNLERPKATVGVNKDTGKNRVFWNSINSADKYVVYRSLNENSGYEKVFTTKGTTYTNTGAVPGKKYYYKVKAINEAHPESNSAYSVTVSRVCDLARPVVTATNRSDGKPRIVWKAVANAEKYEVYRAEVKSGKYKKMFTTKGTSYTNTSAIKGKKYYYMVVAICKNSEGNSANSNVVEIYCK